MCLLQKGSAPTAANTENMSEGKRRSSGTHRLDPSPSHSEGFKIWSVFFSRLISRHCHGRSMFQIKQAVIPKQDTHSLHSHCLCFGSLPAFSPWQISLFFPCQRIRKRKCSPNRAWSCCNPFCLQFSAMSVSWAHMHARLALFLKGFLL